MTEEDASKDSLAHATVVLSRALRNDWSQHVDLRLVGDRKEGSKGGREGGR